ncbi:uncharacterized protein LOC133909933 [Phragmites australis]|uniref:uncharacterized protein LOC133909933 n=1 Tax=Phragmites australis TaxID=29695 RepID=UPI002D796C8D|nr:uncharacterized protein LOC133909933 [Phragmites australis]
MVNTKQSQLTHDQAPQSIFVNAIQCVATDEWQCGRYHRRALPILSVALFLYKLTPSLFADPPPSFDALAPRCTSNPTALAYGFTCSRGAKASPPSRPQPPEPDVGWPLCASCPVRCLCVLLQTGWRPHLGVSRPCRAAAPQPCVPSSRMQTTAVCCYVCAPCRPMPPFGGDRRGGHRRAPLLSSGWLKHRWPELLAAAMAACMRACMQSKDLVSRLWRL